MIIILKDDLEAIHFYSIRILIPLAQFYANYKRLRAQLHGLRLRLRESRRDRLDRSS